MTDNREPTYHAFCMTCGKCGEACTLDVVYFVAGNNGQCRMEGKCTNMRCEAYLEGSFWELTFTDILSTCREADRQAKQGGAVN